MKNSVFTASPLRMIMEHLYPWKVPSEKKNSMELWVKTSGVAHIHHVGGNANVLSVNDIRQIPLWHWYFRVSAAQWSSHSAQRFIDWQVSFLCTTSIFVIQGNYHSISLQLKYWKQQNMPSREAVITILLLISFTLNLKLNSKRIGGKVKTALGKTKVDDT